VASGFKYKNRGLLPDGQLLMILKADTVPGRPKIKVKAKGSAVHMSTLPLSPDANVTAQLRNAGACWDAPFSAPAAVNQGDLFKDKSD